MWEPHLDAGFPARTGPGAVASFPPQHAGLSRTRRARILLDRGVAGRGYPRVGQILSRLAQNAVTWNTRQLGRVDTWQAERDTRGPRPKYLLEGFGNSPRMSRGQPDTSTVISEGTSRGPDRAIWTLHASPHTRKPVPGSCFRRCLAWTLLKQLLTDTCSTSRLVG